MSGAHNAIRFAERALKADEPDVAVPVWVLRELIRLARKALKDAPEED